MKIVQTKTAPNPRRVRIFLAEKGIEVPYEEVDIIKGLKTPEFTRLNPFQRVPVLVLDDGTSISETMAICRYFEETKPEPALFGKGAKQRAIVEMWNRRMELGLLACVAAAFRHLHPAAAQLEVPQVPAWGEANKPQGPGDAADHGPGAGQAPLHRRRRLFGGRHHRAGGGRLRQAGPGGAAAGLDNLARWHQEVSARPSAKA